MTETKKYYKHILSEIPVSINSNYGDAFQPSQWDDTLKKLRILTECEHKGSIMIGSKYIITDSQLEEINKINPDVWLFVSITGIEGSCCFSMSEYEEYYYRACKYLKNVVCVIRPIIPCRNDRIELLLPIIKMVGKGKRMLTYGGFKDPKITGSPQYKNENLFNRIEYECKKNGIVCTEKTVCLVNAINHTDCFVHCKTKPKHLNLIQALGYRFYIKDEKLIMTGYKDSDCLSAGDISFIKMICKSSLVIGDVKSQSQILSIRINNTPLVCTSSWFNWARQIDCAVKCDYCFASNEVESRIDLEYYGCNPIELINILDI